jgi:selenocysteine lyase/cysteine desulfurase
VEWQDHKLIRLSVQGYNTPSDTDRLIEALRILLPQVSR